MLLFGILLERMQSMTTFYDLRTAYEKAERQLYTDAYSIGTNQTKSGSLMKISRMVHRCGEVLRVVSDFMFALPGGVRQPLS